MNRNDEFFDLMNQLNDIPPELEDTVQRAQARVGKRKVWSRVMAPLGTVAAVFALFVVLVNTSPAFAQAMSDIPVLGDLAAMVHVPKSVIVAVENDYIQAIDQTQAGDGFAVTLEYAVIDRQQLNIFFRVDDEDESQPYGIINVNVDCPRHYTVWNSLPDSGELAQFTMEAFGPNVPDRLTLTMDLVVAEDEETWHAVKDGLSDRPVQTVTFELEFDPARIAQGETYPIGQWLELEGQRVYADRLEVYPSNARLILADDPDNELVLTELYCYLEDETGNRYEREGPRFLFGPDTHISSFEDDIQMGSPWFVQPEELTLYVTGAAWGRREELEEEDHWHWVTVDLEGGTAEGLPQGWTYVGALDQVRFRQFTFGTPVQPDGSGIWQHYGDLKNETGVERFALVTTQWSTFAEPITIEVK